MEAAQSMSAMVVGTWSSNVANSKCLRRLFCAPGAKEDPRNGSINPFGGDCGKGREIDRRARVPKTRSQKTSDQRQVGTIEIRQDLRDHQSRERRDARADC